MKRLLLFLTLAAGLLLAHAEGSDDEYLRIYSLIQAGDTLNTAGQNPAALGRYLEAQTALQQFQKDFPDWNPKVVNFRLNYLASRISAVPAKGQVAPTLAPASQAASAPVAPKPAPAGPSDEQRQIAALQEDLRRLQADKSALEAKLREALAAQPAALDPREFSKAQQQIKDLTKENELLKATVPAEKPRPAPAPNTRALEETRRALAEANRQLTEQTDRANSLDSEKQILQRRLDSLAPVAGEAAKLAEIRQALAAANHELASQSELTKQLASEKETLLARVKTLAAKANAVEALRTENEGLKKQLADAKPAPAPPAPDAETAQKPAAAEVRIATSQTNVEISRLEKVTLENRVTTLTNQTSAPPLVSSPVLPPASHPADLARIKLLEHERNELSQMLDAANKELSAREGRAVAARVAALNSRIAALRARLEIYEARAVPYTAAELALFKTPAPHLSAAGRNAGKKSSKSLPGGAAAFVASAQRHLDAKEFDQAEADFLQLLRRDENNAYTLANLAAIQLERGNLDEAEENVKQALASAPEDAYSLTILGQLKFRQGQYDEALDVLSRAAQVNPQSAEIQNYLGVTLSHKGLRVPAETALRRAVTLDPNYGSAHNNLAVVYAAQQPPARELARWHYEKARAAGHPRNEELEKVLGEKAARLGGTP